MSQDTKLAEAIETLLLHFGRGAASEKGVVDDELKDLLTEAAEHAAERRASIARKEQVLLDLLTEDTSSSSPADSTSSSDLMQPGRAEVIDGMRATLHHLFPNLTDEELLEIADET